MTEDLVAPRSGEWLASSTPGAHERLARLYEVSKRLAGFESVARTLPDVLGLLSQTVPLRIAILMLDHGARTRGRSRSIVWQARGTSGAQVREARTRARAAYAYLVRPGTDDDEERGAGRLPVAPPRSSRSGGVVVLPLSVERRPIFGTLQIEGAGALDEADLIFLSAVVTQLATALDRVAVIEAREADARASTEAAELLAAISASLFSSLSDYSSTLDAVARVALPMLADACIVDELTADGRLRRVVAVPAAPDDQRLVDRLRTVDPSEPRSPQSRVVRTGRTVVRKEDPRRGVHASLSAPLLLRGKIFGVLTFLMLAPDRAGRADRAHRADPDYAPADVLLAEEIARRAALAIDNARLYEKAQRDTAARQDLLAVVSHDLRNPLSSILLSAQLVLQAPELPEADRTRRVEAIERGAQRMERIITDLLDIASIEAGQLTVDFERQNVAPLVREALESQAFLATRKAIALLVDGADAELAMDCDRGRILQIFGNLIGNAVKFTPRGGSVSVHVSRREGEVLFSVIDTGPGIALAELPHVFDRFWQAKKTARLGTGLGLSIAQRLVAAHGGRIWVESIVGEGAAFHFTIPLIQTT